MFNGQNLRRKIDEWLAGSISLRDFHLWFAAETEELHNSQEPLKAVAERIDLSLSEYTGGYLSIEGLKGDLAK